MEPTIHPRRWAVYAVHDDGTKMRVTRYSPDKQVSNAQMREMQHDPWWQQVNGRETGDKVTLQVLEGDFQT